jgi:hypothetical protein
LSPVSVPSRTTCPQLGAGDRVERQHREVGVAGQVHELAGHDHASRAEGDRIRDVGGEHVAGVHLLQITAPVLPSNRATARCEPRLPAATASLPARRDRARHARERVRNRRKPELASVLAEPLPHRELRGGADRRRRPLGLTRDETRRRPSRSSLANAASSSLTGPSSWSSHVGEPSLPKRVISASPSCCGFETRPTPTTRPSRAATAW